MVVISDEFVKLTGLSDQEILVEIACRLFDAGKLSLPAAGRLAHLTRTQMEEALMARGIAAYRPTLEDLQQDMESLRKLGM